MALKVSMNRASRTAVLFTLCTVLSAQSTESSTNSATPSTPTFRANSRLVQVDVIVLDRNGQPIRGLTESDLKIFEDGKAQQTRSFDVHETRLSQQPPEPFHLPPHQYTNVPVDESRGPLTVVLFDTLNTPLLDQVAARQHMLQFLETLPPGQQIALFTLGSRLRMIQSFTGQSNV